MTGKNTGELTMTYSAVVTKEQKKAVCVRFERECAHGIDFAEGLLPSCDIVKQQGFTKDELLQLEDYLKQNRSDILEKAKGLNNFINWFR